MANSLLNTKGLNKVEFLTYMARTYQNKNFVSFNFCNSFHMYFKKKYFSYVC